MLRAWLVYECRVLKVDKERYPITQTINQALMNWGGAKKVPGSVAVHIVVDKRTMTGTAVRALNNLNINDLYTDDVSAGWPRGWAVH